MHRASPAPSQPDQRTRPQVVWFKRDLRWTDHEPLWRAAGQGPVLPLWLDEPLMWQQDDASPRQRAALLDAVADVQAWVQSRGGHLLVERTAALPLLQALRQRLGPFTLWSHQETGNGASYQRDLEVAQWARASDVVWHELPGNAVVRRLLTHGGGRDRWSAHWADRMERAPWPEPNVVRWLPLPWTPGAVPAPPADPLRQRSGVWRAQADLQSFLTERGQHYRSAMASPLLGAQACSRVSVHLAVGALSVRQCAHAVWQRRQRLMALTVDERPPGFLASLRSFESRLHWHCHFIQKLETQPSIEHRNVNPVFDGLRNEGPLSELEQAHLQAFATGRTGFPFVDACLRSLEATGWLNFRARAMLMSFASYQLWLHWRHPGLALARWFTDYEPGIHWSQCQMQSGVTGINTVRMYNPIKQGLEHDPDGAFIRRWVPELSALPAAQVHLPGTSAVTATGYPMPVVDLAGSTRQAKERIYGRRAHPDAPEQARRVFVRHGSRNPQREQGGRRRTPARDAAVARHRETQLGFDFDTDTDPGTDAGTDTSTG